MMKISYKTVEKLIFYNKQVQNILPDFHPLFQKWTFAMRAGLRGIVRESLIEFLQSLTDSHLDALSKYFGEPVIVERLNSNTIKKTSVPLTEAQNYLNNESIISQVVLSRNASNLNILFWR